MSPTSFDGLHASSFDAYSPEKWSSNVFTRERLEVKQRVLLLARALEPAFDALGLSVQRYASDEYPSLRNGKKVDAQWVFFWRTEEERLVLEREVDLEQTLAATIADPTPMTRHTFICLRLDNSGIELSLRLHRDAWVDQHNLLHKLADQDLQSEFTSIVRRLPESASISISGKDQGSPLDHDATSFRELLTSHTEDDSGDGFLRIGVELFRDRTIELGSVLVEHLEPTMRIIGELYRFIAWSASNDYISTDDEFLQRRAQRGERRKELEAHEAEHRAAHEAKRREQEAARAELEELFRREAHARPPAPRKPRVIHKTDESSTQQVIEEVGVEAPRQRKAKPPAKTLRPPVVAHPSEPQPVTAGHLAKVSRGPLAGQVGIVQEVDGRGTARIMVGLLATRVPIEDLIGLGPPPPTKS